MCCRRVRPTRAGCDVGPFALWSRPQGRRTHDNCPLAGGQCTQPLLPLWTTLCHRSDQSEYCLEIASTSLLIGSILMPPKLLAAISVLLGVRLSSMNAC